MHTSSHVRSSRLPFYIALVAIAATLMVASPPMQEAADADHTNVCTGSNYSCGSWERMAGTTWCRPIIYLAKSGSYVYAQGGVECNQNRVSHIMANISVNGGNYKYNNCWSPSGHFCWSGQVRLTHVSGRNYQAITTPSAQTMYMDGHNWTRSWR